MGYQENRRSLQHENGKEKERKENPGRPGHKRMRGVNAARGKRGKRREKERDGEKEIHGGVGAAEARGPCFICLVR